jgi:hypothetical protein
MTDGDEEQSESYNNIKGTEVITKQQAAANIAVHQQIAKMLMTMPQQQSKEASHDCYPRLFFFFFSFSYLFKQDRLLLLREQPEKGGRGGRGRRRRRTLATLCSVHSCAVQLFVYGFRYVYSQECTVLSS